MTVVQAVSLVAVALGGGAVALVTDPLRQTFVLGIYGLLLVLLMLGLTKTADPKKLQEFFNEY